MKRWRAELHGVEQTQALGRAIARCARSGDMIALIGELGAGKTQLVKGMAKGMGIDPAAVSSPTFVFMHEYEPPGDQPVLVHVDAYRLDGQQDPTSIGWHSELTENAIVVVEWADRIAAVLEDDCLQLRLTHVDDTTRLVDCLATGDWASRLPAPPNSLEPIACPSCRKLVHSHDRDYPFCSSRCRMVDLNKWLNEDYRITRPIEQADLEEGV